MSKNYDNWERLVTAVLRREHDRQIALSHSRDPSIISSPSSSFSSISRFDHELVHANSHHLPVDHSDLTPLDHRQWKTMLPPDKQELVWRSASLCFFLDQRTGKNCFLLGATKLEFPMGDVYNWDTKSHPKSRFSEVSELVESWQLDIRGRIQMQMLSQETLYAAYLVFGFTDKYAKLESATLIIRFLHNESYYDDSKEQARILHFQSGNSRNSRADGWMEEEMGDFYVGQRDHRHVEAQLLESSFYEKNGLIVEGIEFRPTSTLVSKQEEGKRNRKGKGVFSNFRISG